MPSVLEFRITWTCASLRHVATAFHSILLCLHALTVFLSVLSVLQTSLILGGGWVSIDASFGSEFSVSSFEHLCTSLLTTAVNYKKKKKKLCKTRVRATQVSGYKYKYLGHLDSIRSQQNNNSRFLPQVGVPQTTFYSFDFYICSKLKYTNKTFEASIYM